MSISSGTSDASDSIILIVHFLPATSKSNRESLSSSFVGLIRNLPSLYHIFAAPTGQSNGIPDAITDNELQIIVATHKSIV
ncbi:MAG: hypothetical protein WCG25_09705 [bacterium]